VHSQSVLLSLSALFIQPRGSLPDEKSSLQNNLAEGALLFCASTLIVKMSKEATRIILRMMFWIEVGAGFRVMNSRF
jgi:hypothetical protein